MADDDAGSSAAPHPANCVGSYEDEPHIQDGGCMCDCPACTSGDHVQRCICPDCPGNPECGDHDDR